MHPWCRWRTFWWCVGHIIHQIFQKKKKTVRIKIRNLAPRNSLFLVSTRNDNISRGCAKKMEFPEGRGGSILKGRFWKIQRGGGGHGQNPFRGGVWIFSGTTHCQNNGCGLSTSVAYTQVFTVFSSWSYYSYCDQVKDRHKKRFCLLSAFNKTTESQSLAYNSCILHCTPVRFSLNRTRK